MRITHIALTNFRSFTQLELTLPAGPILFHGANAQGKTTLLEAIYYLATSKSPHASNDRQLLNWYANGSEDPLAVGRLTATVQTAADARPRELEIRLIRELGGGSNDPSFRRQVLVNGVKVRLMDLLGNLNVVLFLPEDVGMVTAPPSERRRFLDITLCQVDRHYCRTLAQYNKVLSQRNALLRSLQERRGRPEELDPWNQKLTELGAVILLRRAEVVANLERRAGQIHFEDLTGGMESLRLQYQPRLEPRGTLSRSAAGSNATPGSGREAAVALLPEAASDPVAWLLDQTATQVADRMRKVLLACRDSELRRGVTLIGPHRDDLRFLVDGRDLAEYGSRGQQRTAVLALKLAEVVWMEAQTGDRPVLLLDEVLAELDQNRRDLLLRHVGVAEQSLLTATDPGMFTKGFMSQAAQMEVVEGQIKWSDSGGAG